MPLWRVLGKSPSLGPTLTFARDRLDFQSNRRFMYLSQTGGSDDHTLPEGSPAMSEACRVRHYGTLFAILAVVSLTHIWSPVKPAGDSMWSIPTALSILRHGTASLNEYGDLQKEANRFAVITVGDRDYTYFPLTTSLFALPVVAVYGLWLTPSDIIAKRRTLENVTASLVVALAAVCIYLTGVIFLDRRYCLVLVFIFAYCTPMWSTCSRVLMQHGPSAFLLSAALYLLVRGGMTDRVWGGLLGFVLAVSYLVRPTNVVSVVLLSVYVMLFRTRAFVWLFAAGGTVAVVFVVTNLWIFGAILPPYFTSRLYFGPNFPEALLGNLVSPARGVFVFCPIFLASLYGIFLKQRRYALTALDFFLMTAVVCHWIVISSFPHWWGGHSYGPRLFSDMAPYCVYFLIPVLQEVSASHGTRKWVLLSVLVPLAAVSFFIHWQGATIYKGYEWNSSPVDVQERPERLWDWQDTQFMRGIKPR